MPKLKNGSGIPRSETRGGGGRGGGGVLLVRVERPGERTNGRLKVGPELGEQNRVGLGVRPVRQGPRVPVGWPVRSTGQEEPPEESKRGLKVSFTHLKIQSKSRDFFLNIKL